MRKQLCDLRREMKRENIDWYIIPTTDFHGTEYVNDYFKGREFLSGFTGSAGTLLVGLDDAYLWTDGRYFLQAEIQLENSGIDLMKMGEPNVPSIFDFLKEKSVPKTINLGFDGRVISKSEGLFYESLNANIYWEKDLVDRIWEERPALNPSEIYELPLSVTGKSTDDKLMEIRSLMAKKNADYLVLTSLEEIAWLFNMRGDDVANTPVFLAFAIISENDVEIFLNSHCLPKGFKKAQVSEYSSIYTSISEIPGDKVLWLNGSQSNYYLFKHINNQISIIDEPSPIELMKAIKNPIEIQCSYNSQKKDGIAMVKFINWLKSNINKKTITEISAADFLEKSRRNDDSFLDLSFTTISGYNQNGAIIHYEPTLQTNATLKSEGFLLVDSGAHYIDGGTTDITRTISLGPLTDKMKKCYTAVLKAHIALASAIFPKGTIGYELDKITRIPIQEIGYDYNHGTGHGVGHLLSVHEGPQSISKRENIKQEILSGMITSDEPGIYLEGEFGIRLESLLLCKESSDGNLYFESMTYCPFDKAAILPEMMTKEEIQWLNNYHATVREKLRPYLTKELAEWLDNETQALASF